MFAKDVIDKISMDFGTTDDVDLALSVLADFMDQNQELSSDRILRCIVFVAKGDINILEKAVDMAKTDYRDLIVWAENDGGEEQARDLSKAFPSIPT